MRTGSKPRGADLRWEVREHTLSREQARNNIMTTKSTVGVLIRIVLSLVVGLLVIYPLFLYGRYFFIH